MSSNFSDLQCAYCGETFPASFGHKCDYEKLKKQNKQYKKALKDILISDECFKGDILKRMHAMQDVARQALQNK
ncbi:hypothetical protein ACFOZ1_15180 [Gracilibacillus marinus]|uniref:IDEAL domain-containing protein n=1 Tax=Gracilibacillus marinus TaxID=630535 RepID=A0ABV8VX81_9BACI